MISVILNDLNGPFVEFGLVDLEVCIKIKDFILVSVKGPFTELILIILSFNIGFDYSALVPPPPPTTHIPITNYDASQQSSSSQQQIHHQQSLSSER